MHIGGGRLRVRMAHQLTQHQQVDARRGEFGAESVPEPVRPDPGRAAAGPVGSEDTSQSRLGHRLTGGRASQHDEALRRRQPSGPFGTQIRGQFGEERSIDRDDPLLGALAHHLHLPQTDIDIGEAQRPDLRRSQAAQEHHQDDRPVPVRSEIGEEHGDVIRVEALGQAPLLAHQPSRRTPSTATNVTEQTTA